MKTFFASLFVLISYFSIAQNKDISEKDTFSVHLALSAGSLKTDKTINNEPIRAFIISPKLEFGNAIKLHVGANIITIDSGNFDTIQRTQGDMEFGFSAEKQLTNQPIYLKGGYLIRINENYGNRVFAQVGFVVNETIDFHLIASRLYARKEIFSGNIVEFGVRLKL